MNKRLAYFEAQCSPNGKPIKLADGSVGIRQSQMKEYTYLWKTRCRFLEAIYDMNHDRRLNENWQCEKVHGYVHRLTSGTVMTWLSGARTGVMRSTPAAYLTTHRASRKWVREPLPSVSVSSAIPFCRLAEPRLTSLQIGTPFSQRK